MASAAITVSEVLTLKVASGILPAMFLFRRLTLFFRFTYVHTAKLKKSNFRNDFFLSLTEFARVTSFLTRFSECFLGYLHD